MKTAFFWLTFYNLRLARPLQYFILRELLDCSSVLDLGCGKHSMIPILPSKTHTVGVEAFTPHYEEATRSGRHKEYINQDITKVDFPDNSFDAVVLMDVLEHLPKEEGLKLLQKMQRWARKKIAVFTPNGFLEQHKYDDNPLMKHLSGWEVGEFKKMGFKVYGVRGFRDWKKDEHHHDHDREHPEVPLVESLADLSQVITYYRPKDAYQLFCVKKKEKS